MLGITDHGKQSPRLAREHPWRATDTILIANVNRLSGVRWGSTIAEVLMLVYSVMGVRQCERHGVCVYVCVCVCVCVPVCVPVWPTWESQEWLRGSFRKYESSAR